MPPSDSFTNADADAVREHWDDQAASYSDAKQRNAAYFDALRALFDRAVGGPFRERMLEVGCGTGEVLASLAPARGVGVDISPRMIEQARAKFAGRPDLSFEVGDAGTLASLGAFDAVISADVLEHVPDWPALVDAMVDACRAGGLVAVATPSPRWALPLWVLEKCRLKMPEGPHKFVPLRDFAARMESRGCTIVHRGTHQMMPARVAGLGPRVSAWAESAPLFRHLGVIQLVVAEKNA